MSNPITPKNTLTPFPQPEPETQNPKGPSRRNSLSVRDDQPKSPVHKDQPKDEPENTIIDKNSPGYKAYRRKVGEIGQHALRYRKYYEEKMLPLFHSTYDTDLGLSHKIKTKLFGRDLPPMKAPPDFIRTAQDFDLLKQEGRMAAIDHVQELAHCYMADIEAKRKDISPEMEASYWMQFADSRHYGLEAHEFEDMMLQAFINIRNEDFGKQIIEAAHSEEDLDDSDYDSEYSDYSDYSDDSDSDDLPDLHPLPSPEKIHNTQDPDTIGEDPIESVTNRKKSKSVEQGNQTIATKTFEGEEEEDDDDDNDVLNGIVTRDGNYDTIPLGMIRSTDGIPVDGNGNPLHSEPYGEPPEDSNDK